MINLAKPQISLALIGHVDCGKSSVIGHFMFKGGGFDKRTIEMLKNRWDGYGRFNYYTGAVDKHRDEIARGVTIYNSSWRLETPKNEVILLNLPGHRDFTKNIVRGLSEADAAVLVVGATPGEYEAGISLDGQTKEHALLAYTFGVKQLIVAVNKMDDKAVNFSKERYNEICKELGSLLKKIGYLPEKILFIPVSAWHGDNMIEKSENMKWYQGPTLLEAIDSLIPPKRQIEKPFRIAIEDSHKIGGVGTVVVGKVVSGSISRGMNVTFAKAGITAEVKSIESYHQVLEKAEAGISIGLNIKNVHWKDIKRGDVCGDPGNEPPKCVSSFIAQIIVLDHPTQINKGYSPFFCFHQTHCPCKIEEIQARIDRKTGEILEENPETIKKGDAAILQVYPLQPICIESFKEFPQLGRFCIRENRRTIAVGVIKSVEKLNISPPKKG